MVPKIIKIAEDLEQVAIEMTGKADWQCVVRTHTRVRCLCYAISY